MNPVVDRSDQSGQCRNARSIVVIFKSASAAIGFVLVMAAAAGAALAEDESGQKPPEKSQCIASNTGFKEKGRAATYEIELINSCDMRLKCTVDAFVIGARGQTQGHGTLVLAAAPKGETTRKTYVMKVKSAGGMANVSHRCKAI
jgi:hypothetical protein